MNYPCGMIRDLLPLYHDGVCGPESAAAVEEHLALCETCREQYQKLQDSDLLTPSCEQEENGRQIHALKQVKRSIRWKRILACALTVLTVLALSGGTAGYLHAKTESVPPEDIAEVVWSGGDLQARLQGSTYVQASSKRVTLTENGQPIEALYFCLLSTLWDRAWASTTNGGAFYTLAPEGKGAQEIDRVYYFTGGFQQFKELTTEQLEQGSAQAVLLWSR